MFKFSLPKLTPNVAALALLTASVAGALYAENATKESPGIGVKEEEETKPPALVKEANATQEIKGKIIPYCLWIDPQKWNLLEQNLNPIAEYSLSLKNGEVFAMVLPEKEQVPLNMVPDIIIQGAEANGVKNAKIVEKEMRNVNGTEVLHLKWTGEIQDMKFIYVYDIYSGDRGTVQLVAYTLQDLYNKYSDEIDKFLNGFCLQPEAAKPAVPAPSSAPAKPTPPTVKPVPPAEPVTPSPSPSASK